MRRFANRFDIIHYFKNCLFILIISLFCFNVSANNEGKVSVIIPVYNVEKYIRECLDSVINQTYKNLEIICVDDCGTDNSVKIIEEYAQKDRRIKIFRHDKNMGAGRARNTGVQNSNGEYIFFLDSDDYLNLDIIELMVRNQNETGADVVVSSFRNFVSEKIPNKKIPKVKAKLKARDCIKSLRQKQCPINFDNFQDSLISVFCAVWGKLYKKNFLIENDIWHINQNIYAEDAGFWLKVLSNFPLVFYMNNIGVNYRMNLYSITMTLPASKCLADLQIMLKDFFQYLDQHFEKDKAEKLKELTTNSRLYKKILKPSISQSILFLIIDILEFFSE